MSDMGGVFFKAIADNGRVASFKAKANAAVEAATKTYCSEHAEEEPILCIV